MDSVARCQLRRISLATHGGANTDALMDQDISKRVVQIVTPMV